jgi:branched-chain amino acid transport system ATP-binding protein
MERQESILQIENLKKHFGNLHVLDGISFSVEEQEILGIAGPNGAGKTTLFNLISGMFPLTGGDIRFRGKSTNKMKAHQVCSLGIARTFQTPVVFPTLTVRENLEIGAVFGNIKISRKQQEKLIDDTLDFLDLNDLAQQISDNLSLYDKKRVMLGASLTTRPTLLLLDEPAAGLPRNEIEHFMGIIRRLNAERKVAVLIIEHLIDWLSDISEKLLIIHGGTVMAYGRPKEVVNDEAVIEIYLGKEPDES